MINITHKSPTLRIAIAQAVVAVSQEETIRRVLEKRVPKGDVFETARTAGLFAAKRTSDVIPDCHPLPVEYTAVRFSVSGLEIHVETEIHTIYKTGVEVEAMYTASVVALTIYDMLKPVDKDIRIEHIRLLEKKGGKSDFRDVQPEPLRAMVIVCSDSVSSGKKEDRAGQAVMEKLRMHDVTVSGYQVIPDDMALIREKVNLAVQEGMSLVMITGGTGLSAHDVTPEALEPILEKRIPGIEEAIRSYGQERMPYAMLSRSVVGLIGKTLVMALPGSTRGAAESMDAVFPHVLHVFYVLRGGNHGNLNVQ